MYRARHLVWFVPIVALGFFVWSFASKGYKQKSEPKVSPSALFELRERVQQLEAERRHWPMSGTSDGRAGMLVGSTPAPTDATPTEPVAVKPRLTPEEREYRQVVYVEAQTKKVSEVMAQEPLDASWAREASSQIRTRYSGEDFEGVTLQAECKSTMCKISAGSNEPDKSAKAMRTMINNPPWPAPGFYHMDKKTNEVVAFISRETFELPLVDKDSLTY